MIFHLAKKNQISKFVKSHLTTYRVTNSNYQEFKDSLVSLSRRRIFHEE